MAELTIVKADTLPVETRTVIDKQIDAIIAQHKSNRGEINRLVFDSVSALAAGQARSAELANRGFFKRFIGSITGKNNKLQSEINRNYALAQYASQQTLQKLAEQNLMSFELIMAVNNKLNAMMIDVANSFIEVNKEINNIYEILGAFFKQSRSELLSLKSDVEDLKKRASILEWEAAIEYQVFDGKEYNALSKTGKIICLVKDFYQITEGNWSERNLLLFKAALGSVDLNPKDKISYIEFLNALMKEPELLEKLFDDVDLEKVDSEYTMILGVGKKYKLLTTDEKYQVDTLSNIMTDQDIQLPKEEIIRQLIVQYITNISQENMQAESSIYEFSLELLYNLWQVKHYAASRYTEMDDLEELGKRGDVYRYKSVFENAAKAGNGRAAYYLALSFCGEQQKKILEMGIQTGNILCKSHYFRSFGGEFTKAEYEQIYDLAAAGDYIAQNELYYLMMDGYEGIVEKNECEALKWLERSAEQDYADSQNDMGYCYHLGQGVEQDYDEAVKWFRKAADQGYASGQNALGMMYANGNGVEQDYAEAVKWRRKAADQGYAGGQNALGMMYANGYGVEQDYAEAVKWYRKAADQGYASGQNNLGWMYKNGYGVEQDYAEAVKWYRKAADQGYALGQYELGWMYQDGKGVKQDYAEAVKWYRKAADQGNALGQNNLGVMYYNGEGVKQDYAEAVKWYQKAADQGDEVAKSNLASMQK